MTALKPLSHLRWVLYGIKIGDEFYEVGIDRPRRNRLGDKGASYEMWSTLWDKLEPSYVVALDGDLNEEKWPISVRLRYAQYEADRRLWDRRLISDIEDDAWTEYELSEP